MPAPVVSWWSGDNSQQQTQWNIGTVDAGSASDTAEFLIWNNRAGGTDVSDMTNCTITTKDNTGGNTGELVENTWIQVKVDSLGETGWTNVGGTVTKELRAESADVSAGVIEGAGNVGDLTADHSYCRVTLRANVPPTATAGLVNFLTRVSYQYV